MFLVSKTRSHCNDMEIHILISEIDLCTMSECLSIDQSFDPYTCPSIHIYKIYLYTSIYLSTQLSIHIYLSFNLSIYLSIYLSIFIYLSIHLSIYLLYMKSLIAKGARSIFMTSEKNVFLCASLYTRLWKTQY